MSETDSTTALFLEAFGGEAPRTYDARGADPDDFVVITWPAAGDCAVTISRALIPDPVARDQAERALRSAVTELVTHREQTAAAAGTALGRVLAASLESDVGQQQREVEARVQNFRSEVEARQAAIRARRDRLAR